MRVVKLNAEISMRLWMKTFREHVAGHRYDLAPSWRHEPYYRKFGSSRDGPDQSAPLYGDVWRD